MYSVTEKYNVKIELRMRNYSGAESSSYSSSYSVSTLLTKPCTFERRILYYNKLLLHKIDTPEKIPCTRILFCLVRTGANVAILVEMC